jgi:hypothetical protein
MQIPPDQDGWTWAGSDPQASRDGDKVIRKAAITNTLSASS